MSNLPLRDVTEDEIRSFERDGVVCLRGVIDGGWIERMQGAMEHVLAHPGPQGVDNNPRGSSGRFALDVYLWTFDDDFRALALDSPLAAIAARLMRSARVNFLYDCILTKEPHSPYPTHWHQDQPGNPVDGRQVCGIWMPLDTVTIESGAVEYIRGSHRWGLWFDSHGNKLQDGHSFFKGPKELLPKPGDRGEFEAMPDFEAARDDHDIVHFDTEPGDCVVNHLLTVHSAPGNTTARRRRAVGTRWGGDDSTFAVRKARFRLIPPWDPGLLHGDPFPRDHDLYPQAWPRPVGKARRRISRRSKR